MKSKKQKRAEALSRLKASPPSQNPGRQKARDEHIRYLESIAGREGGRVRHRKSVTHTPVDRSPGNPVGMPPHIWEDHNYGH
jgi:hypothetical protein